MDAQVKNLGILFILAGGVGGLAAFFYFGFFAGPAATAAYGPAIEYIASGWILLSLILMIPCVVLGIGLLKLRPWTRSLGTIVAILELLNFPLGTALGVYALWVLLSPETDRLLTPRFRA